MSSILPPQPTGVPPNHAYWNDWYNKLRAVINGIATSIKWINLDFTGSKIEDIISRPHNKLQSIQGGTTNEYYHLTNAEHSAIIGLANPNITSTGLDMVITTKSPGVGQDGGFLTITAQAATDTTKNGGQILLSAGNGGSGAGTTGGGVQFIAGDGTTLGGAVLFTAGNGNAAGSFGGSFNLVAGSSYGAGGYGGDSVIQGGNGTTAGSAKLNTPSNLDGVVVTESGGVTLISLYGATPTAQHTTSSGSSAFVANTGTTINTSSTFDGYTVAQVVKALRDMGILA